MRRLYILIYTLLSASNVFAQVQDSVYIKNFSTGDYKAASINYSGIMDENGLLYFANENGILEYDGSEWEIIPIINFSATYSIKISDAGRFYIGGQNEFGYIDHDSLNNYKYTSLRNIVPEDHEFGPFWQIETLGENVYFSSYEGLVHYDGEKGTLIDVKNSSIFTMGNELIISKLNDGLYTLKNDSIQLINDDYKWENDNIYSVVPDLKNESQYLLFSSENGIYSFDPSTNKMQPFATSNDDFVKKKGIYQAQIWRDSLYAIATWTGGFILMDQEGTLSKPIDKSKGLQSDALRDFIIDKRGNVWAGSTAGISYLKWPFDDTHISFKPKTIITKAAPRRDPNNVLRSLEFHFATPGYDKSDLLYSYYLKGFEKDYCDWTTDIKKEYTNLDGGTYDFYVKAKKPDGTETLAASYPFTIPTPWYQNKLFYLALFLALGSSFYYVYKYRTKRLKMLNKRLEKIINNRTEELIFQKEQLRDANEELIVANTELDNFVYRSSHDLVAPLKSLKGLINLAKIEAPDNRQEEYLSLMGKSVAKLEEFIKSIMEYSINSKREVLKKEVQIDGIIEGIRQDLKYYSNIEKITFIKNFEKSLVVMSDESRLKIVLSNLITNCIKYHNYNQESPKIEITVKQPEAKNITIIEVTDNGVGIDDEHVDKIFDMFFRASSDKSEGSGLGLYIVKDTVGKLGGQIAVSSVLGKGTTFTLKLFESVTVMSLSSD
ncbi:MAG TPA: ATP-binding protein [Fulvivirga sp.]|nr:ATP-binding protein [Fulvivirga sp.]